MPRDGAEARARLTQAAMELYAARGYDHTTTAEIAQRAGVTERTFFRHFADKREVFFGNDAQVLEWLAIALATVPAGVRPVEVVLQVFRSRIPTFHANRAVYQTRRRVLSATPALAERERTKDAAMIVVVAEALRDRGLSDCRAMLLARLSIAAQTHAMHTWSADPALDIEAVMVSSFADIIGIDQPAELTASASPS